MKGQKKILGFGHDWGVAGWGRSSFKEQLLEEKEFSSFLLKKGGKREGPYRGGGEGRISVPFSDNNSKEGKKKPL